MLPLASVYSTNPIQTPLVNTALPGSAVTHVPYDNVAPSVSNAQVENNTKGNSEISSAAASEPPASENAAASAAAAAGDAANLGTIAQATFLAQLASQDSSPATQVILVEYEKLVSISSIKYKPSNAQKPEAGPSNAFSRLLQEENTAPATPSASATVAAKAPVTLEQAQVQAVPAVRLVVSKAAKGAGAYAASAGRVAANSNTVAELA